MTSKGEDFYAEMDCDQLLKIAQLAVAECSQQRRKVNGRGLLSSYRE